MTENDEELANQKLWFVRHGGKAKGPYPSGSIRRFVLLGRVALDDEVSNDRKQWRVLSTVPEVIPPEVRRALAEGTVDELLIPRMREDERDGRERRTSSNDEDYRKRRKGERRQAELEIMQHHRKAKTDLLERRGKRPLPLVGIAVTATLVTLVIGFGLYLGAPPTIPDPDCSATPMPGVNWRNCKLDRAELEGVEMDGAQISNGLMREANLTGSKLNQADLKYLDLTESDLSYAELKLATLKGATLRGADLSYADLSGADLSYADLTRANLGGARLSGARLENAIWVNGATCIAGSVGVCKVAR